MIDAVEAIREASRRLYTQLPTRLRADERGGHLVNREAVSDMLAELASELEEGQRSENLWPYRESGNTGA